MSSMSELHMVISELIGSGMEWEDIVDRITMEYPLDRANASEAVFNVALSIVDSND